MELFPFIRPLGNLDITEKGIINATALGTDAEAYGVDAYSIDSFVNAGDILVTAAANGTAVSQGGAEVYAEASGVDAKDSIGNFTNNGDIMVTASADGTADGALWVEIGAEAYGVYAGSIGNFTNTGDIMVTAAANGTATSERDARVYAYAEGVEAGSIGNFTNTGDISVTATANGTANGTYWARVEVEDAYGIYADYIGNFTNTGDIMVTAAANGTAVSEQRDARVYAEAYGVYAGSIDSFVNAGDILVTAIANGAANGTSWAYVGADAYGVYAEIGNFTNDGTISVTAIADGTAVSEGYAGVYADAYGVDAYSIDSFTNAGDISVTAIADGTAVSEGYAGVYADAYGVNAGSIDNFINNGNILVSANSEGGSAYATGIFVYEWDTLGNFTNTGNIIVFANATTEVSATGVYADYINGNFINDGLISVTAIGGEKVCETYGVYINEEVSNFTNTGIIAVNATVGNATGEIAYTYIWDVSGVTIDGAAEAFINNGTIRVDAIAGNALGESSEVEVAGISGVEIRGSVGDFINNKNIFVNVIVGDAEGNGSQAVTMYPEYSVGVLGVYGVYIGNNVVDVYNFTNTGNIIASATAGSAIGDNSYVGTGWVIGVDIGSDGDYGQVVDNFTNQGNIVVSAKAGSAIGENSTIEVLGVSPVWIDYSTVNNFENKGLLYGLIEAGNATGIGSYVFLGYASSNGFLGDVGNFTNTGSIVSIAKAGSALGANSTIEISDIGGIYFGGYVENFINNGSIITQVEAGSALGENSNVTISYIAPVGFDGGIGSVENKGNLVATVKAGANSVISDVAGLVIVNSDGGLAINSGNIYVDIDAPVAASVDRVAGIFVKDSNIELSNPGAIYLFTNNPNSNLRTLWLEGSEVTLVDKFAITFGMPGINPDMRPIYVGSGSTLDLNNATLIARADSRGIGLGIPYYLIDNSGSVEGQWGGLERGYINPDIQVSWYDPTQLGENSAVIFEYVPTSLATAPVTGGMGGVPIVISGITGFIFDHSPLFMSMVKRDERSIMVASSSISEATYVAPLYQSKGLVWLMPVYMRVNADDLGFDADAYGFVMGLGGRLTNNLGAEIFGGYVYDDLDFDVLGADSEDQDLFIGGINIIYQYRPWFVRFIGLGYYTNHDYKGYTGLNYELVEKADYDSYGTRLELLGGYLVGKKVRFIPQIGLSYSYYKTEDFWTKVPDNPNLRRKYEPEDLNVWKIIADLGIVSDFEVNKKSSMRLFGGARVEQAISDNDISTITLCT